MIDKADEFMQMNGVNALFYKPVKTEPKMQRRDFGEPFLRSQKFEEPGGGEGRKRRTTKFSANKVDRSVTEYHDSFSTSQMEIRVFASIAKVRNHVSPFLTLKPAGRTLLFL